MLKLIIISGRSGSGKSTALHVLEDIGYYCIDNLPLSLLPPLVDSIAESGSTDRISVSIDARNITADLQRFPEIIQSLDDRNLNRQIVYLDSASPRLVRRFSETRRKHPLSNQEMGLREALEYEKKLLEPIATLADLNVDTTSLTLHQLRDLIRTRVAQQSFGLALLFESFAYRNGVPVDADLVFDVRCLPNPHWKDNLRLQTGLDQDVIEFLASQTDCVTMYEDIMSYLESWLPKFEQNNRSYITIAVGCTGGQHRSVYLSQKLYQHFAGHWDSVQVRHRELSLPAVDV
jgi:UPF0042 nucleotide-binding protein